MHWGEERGHRVRLSNKSMYVLNINDTCANNKNEHLANSKRWSSL